mgnify:CR=1 FL=1
MSYKNQEHEGKGLPSRKWKTVSLDWVDFQLYFPASPVVLWTWASFKQKLAYLQTDRKWPTDGRQTIRRQAGRHRYWQTDRRPADRYSQKASRQIQIQADILIERWQTDRQSFRHMDRQKGKHNNKQTDRWHRHNIVDIFPVAERKYVNSRWYMFHRVKPWFFNAVLHKNTTHFCKLYFSRIKIGRAHVWTPVTL